MALIIPDKYGNIFQQNITLEGAGPHRPHRPWRGASKARRISAYCLRIESITEVPLASELLKLLS